MRLGRLNLILIVILLVFTLSSSVQAVDVYNCNQFMSALQGGQSEINIKANFACTDSVISQYCHSNNVCGMGPNGKLHGNFYTITNLESSSQNIHNENAMINYASSYEIIQNLYIDASNIIGTTGPTGTLLPFCDRSTIRNVKIQNAQVSGSYAGALYASEYQCNVDFVEFSGTVNGVATTISLPNSDNNYVTGTDVNPGDFQWGSRSEVSFKLNTIRSTPKLSQTAYVTVTNSDGVSKKYTGTIDLSEYTVNVPIQTCLESGACSSTTDPISKLGTYTYNWSVLTKDGRELNVGTQETFTITKGAPNDYSISRSYSGTPTTATQYTINYNLGSSISPVYVNAQLGYRYPFTIQIYRNGAWSENITHFATASTGSIQKHLFASGTYQFYLNSHESDFYDNSYVAGTSSLNVQADPRQPEFQYFEEYAVSCDNPSCGGGLADIENGAVIDYSATQWYLFYMNGEGYPRLNEQASVFIDGVEKVITKYNTYTDNEQGRQVQYFRHWEQFNPGSHSYYYQITDLEGRTVTSPTTTFSVTPPDIDFDYLINGAKDFLDLQNSNTQIYVNSTAPITFTVNIYDESNNLIDQRTGQNELTYNYNFPNRETYKIEIDYQTEGVYPTRTEEFNLLIGTDDITGFTNIQLFNVSNGLADVTSYPVIYIVDTATLITQGKLKADCSDLRILPESQDVMLPYYIEDGCGTDKTIVWFKADLPKGITTFRLATGNEFVSSIENPSNVFDYFDGFDTNTGWTQVLTDIACISTYDGRGTFIGQQSSLSTGSAASPLITNNIEGEDGGTLLLWANCGDVSTIEKAYTLNPDWDYYGGFRYSTHRQHQTAWSGVQMIFYNDGAPTYLSDTGFNSNWQSVNFQPSANPTLKYYVADSDGTNINNARFYVDSLYLARTTPLISSNETIPFFENIVVNAPTNYSPTISTTFSTTVDTTLVDPNSVRLVVNNVEYTPSRSGNSFSDSQVLNATTHNYYWKANTLTNIQITSELSSFTINKAPSYGNLFIDNPITYSNTLITGEGTVPSGKPIEIRIFDSNNNLIYTEQSNGALSLNYNFTNDKIHRIEGHILDAPNYLSQYASYEITPVNESNNPVIVEYSIDSLMQRTGNDFTYELGKPINFNVNANDQSGISKIVWTIDGVDQQELSYPNTFQSTFASGTYSYSVTVQDNAGNSITSQTEQFRVLPQTVVLTTSINNNQSTNQSYYLTDTVNIVSYTSPSGYTHNLSIYRDGILLQSDEASSFNTPYNLDTEGIYLINFTFQENENYTLTPQHYYLNVTKETSLPIIQDVSLTTQLETEEGKYLHDANELVYFNVQASDENGMATTIWTINGESQTINYGTPYSRILDVGNYEYNVTVIDNYGNNVTSQNYNIDVLPKPVILTTSISGDSAQNQSKILPTTVNLISSSSPNNYPHNMSIYRNGVLLSSHQGGSLNIPLDLDTQAIYTINFSIEPHENFSLVPTYHRINVSEETTIPIIQSFGFTTDLAMENQDYVYDINEPVDFTVEATDESGIKNVVWTIDGISQSINYGTTFSKILGAGTHYYNVSVYDNYDNVNISSTEQFTILPKVVNIVTEINGDQTQEISKNLTDTINIVSYTVPSGIQHTVSIYHNGVLEQSNIGSSFNLPYQLNNEGVYTFNFTFEQNSNYTTSPKYHIVNVAKETVPPVIVSDIVNSPSEYHTTQNTTFTLTATDQYGLDSNGKLVLNGIEYIVPLQTTTYFKSVYLPAGNYYYNWTIEDIFENKKTTQTKSFTINKKQPAMNVIMNGQQNNIVVAEFEVIDVNLSLTEPTDFYSFNVTRGNEVIREGSQDTDFNERILFQQQGEYQINIYYPGNANYNYARKNLNVTVTDELNPPTVTLESLTYNQIYNNSKITNFLLNGSDLSGLRNTAELVLDGVSKLVIYQGIYNYSQVLPAGSHTYFWRLYDTNNNVNETEPYTFTINKATPALQILINGQETDQTTQSFEPIQLNALVSEPYGKAFSWRLLKDDVLISSQTRTNVNTISSIDIPDNYTYEIVFNGDENYTTNSKSVDIEVLPETNAPIIDLVTHNVPERFNLGAVEIAAFVRDQSVIDKALLNLNGQIIDVNIAPVNELTALYNANLLPGTYYYNWTIIDAIGNTQVSETKSFNQTKGLPEFTIKLNGYENDITSEVGTYVNIYTSFDNPGGEYNLSIFDSNRNIIQSILSNQAESFQILIANEDDRIINVSYLGNDNYTQGGLEYKIYFGEDVTKPVINIENQTIPQSPVYYRNTVTFLMNASDFSGLANTAKLNLSGSLIDVEYINGTYAYPVDLEAGNYNYNWIVSDTKGNQMITQSQVMSIIKSAINATVSFNNSHTNQTAKIFVNISGNVNQAYNLYINGTKYTSAKSDTYNFSTLKAGAYNVDFEFNGTISLYRKIINNTIIMTDEEPPLGVNNLNVYNYSQNSSVLSFDPIPTADFASYQVYVDNELINQSNNINERFYIFDNFTIGQKYVAKLITSDINGNQKIQTIDFVFARDFKPIKINRTEMYSKAGRPYFLIEFNNDIQSFDRSIFELDQNNNEIKHGLYHSDNQIYIYPIDELENEQNLTIQINSGLIDRYDQIFESTSIQFIINETDLDKDGIRNHEDLDIDGDGLNETTDNLVGNISFSNYQQDSLLVGTITKPENKSFSNLTNIQLKSGINTILSFNHNFSKELDLRDISIIHDNINGNSLIVSGVNQTGTKDLSFKQINSSNNNVCVIDSDNISAISTKCTTGNFVECNGVTQNGYTCNIVNEWFVVTGLKNSILTEICSEQWTYSSWGACNGGIQTRSATDSAGCGTSFQREALSQGCSVPSSSSSGGGGGGGRRRTIILNDSLKIAPNETKEIEKVVETKEVKEEPEKNITEVIEEETKVLEDKVDQVVTQQPAPQIVFVKNKWKLLMQILIIILLCGLLIEFAMDMWVKPKKKTNYSESYSQVDYSQPVFSYERIQSIEKPNYRKPNPRGKQFKSKINIMKRVKSAMSYDEPDSHLTSKKNTGKRNDDVNKMLDEVISKTNKLKKKSKKSSGKLIDKVKDAMK